LTLENGTLVQYNQAIGGDGSLGSKDGVNGTGGNASGGGIYVAGGTANLTAVTIDKNVAQGGAGASWYFFNGNNTSLVNAPGGNAFGGGVALARGTVSISGSFVNYNSAIGGTSLSYDSWITPEALGGGVYVAAGTVTLCTDSVQYNVVDDPGLTPNRGYGDGIYIVSGAKVYIDQYTLSNTIYNYDPDGSAGQQIDGSYILQNC